MKQRKSGKRLLPKLAPIALSIGLAVAAIAPAEVFAASTADQQAHQVLGWGAGRIVGTFETTDGKIGLCGMEPTQPVGNTLSFNAGGTVTESPQFPPIGAPGVFGLPGVFTRNIGLGTWSYNPHTNHYSMHLQYYFFEDGEFYGRGTVDRDIVLSADGKTASGPVESIVYAADGSVIVDLCGTATSTRL